jgi:hypothetical protein
MGGQGTGLRRRMKGLLGLGMGVLSRVWRGKGVIWELGTGGVEKRAEGR